MDKYDNTPDGRGDPSPVAHLIAAATSYLHDGEYSKVMDVTACALQIDPNCIKAYELRVLIDCLILDYSGLVSDCTELIRLRPDHALAYIDRARAFIHFGQPEKAILDCTKALEFASDSKNVHQWSPDSSETFESAPDSANAYATRAQAYLLLGLVDEFHADWHRGFILSATPERIAEFDHLEFVTNLLRRAQILIDAGEYGMAVEACSAVLCDEPEHIEARRQRGIAYQGLGRFEESSHDLAKAWELKLEHDRIGRSYVVTLEGSTGEKIYAAFPETPQGRNEAIDSAQCLVADEKAQEELAHFVGQAGVVNVYLVKGTEVEKEDWIWIERDGDEPPAIVYGDISGLD